jgi:galactonate dehydratase
MRASMRITSVDIHTMGTSWRNLIFVKVNTDEGLYGVGEATIQNREEGVLAYLAAAVRRFVVGSDPFDIEQLWLRMYRDDYWRGGVIQTTAMSAIEIACWDIVGKAAGLPIYKLLGGRAHDRIKCYANGWYTVERTPEEFARLAKETVARGFKALKVDPFGAGFYELNRDERIRSVELVEAIRDAVGPDVEIFIEGHGRFSPQSAVEIARDLEPFRPGWFEEPVPPENLAALQEVKQRVSVPIATGERMFTRFAFPELLERRCADIIQPDVIHAGGILEMKKIAAMADAYYRVMAPHNANSPLCTMASLHFGFSTTNFKIQETFDDFTDEWVWAALPGAPRQRDGFYEPPTAPGLGIDLNLDVIAEHPFCEGFFNLFAEDWHKRQFAQR